MDGFRPLSQLFTYRKRQGCGSQAAGQSAAGRYAFCGHGSLADIHPDFVALSHVALSH